MLIEKKPVVGVNDVISLKLVTGEELIGKITAMDDNSITLSKLLIVQMQMVSANQAGIAFAPFMATADNSNVKFRFERSRFLCDPIKPRSDISSKYTAMTTGLEIPAMGNLKI
jgi:hypothetical protein